MNLNEQAACLPSDYRTIPLTNGYTMLTPEITNGYRGGNGAHTRATYTLCDTPANA